MLPWKSKRFSIITRVALAGSFSLVFFAFSMLFIIENELQHAIYGEIDSRVRSAEGLLSELTLAKGPPTVARGVLRFGPWVANADVSLVDRVRARLVQHFASAPSVTVADLKTMTELPRKQAVLLLEHFDQQGLTRRKGDVRVLVGGKDGK